MMRSYRSPWRCIGMTTHGLRCCNVTTTEGARFCQHHHADGTTIFDVEPPHSDIYAVEEPNQ